MTMKTLTKHSLLTQLHLSALILVPALTVWASAAAAADNSVQLALGQKLFTQGAVPACSLCHTLQAAGAEVAIGPILDELKPDATRVAKALRNGLGQMPSYKDKLSDAEIAALAFYVSKVSGGAQ